MSRYMKTQKVINAVATRFDELNTEIDKLEDKIQKLEKVIEAITKYDETPTRPENTFKDRCAASYKEFKRTLAALGGREDD